MRATKGKMVLFGMTDYVQQAVEHYKRLSGITSLKPARTPYCPENSLKPQDEEHPGALQPHACSILMKDLWAARLSRPDLSRAVCRLASRVTKWTRNDDRKVQRLMEYMNSTVDYKLKGYVGDSTDDLELWLFVDADLAGDTEDARSTSGGFLVIVGPSTWFPITWIHNKQTATSRSTTEAEGISLGTALVNEAYPVWDLLELILGRTVVLRVKEDNQATIKIFKKGYSQKLAHVKRTHKINLGTIYEAISDHSVQLEYVESGKQVADVFTKDLAPAAWPNALELLGLGPHTSPGVNTAVSTTNKEGTLARGKPRAGYHNKRRNCYVSSNR